MTSTSIRLAFSNQRIDPAQIADILGVQPSREDVLFAAEAKQERAVLFWELCLDKAYQVETQLPHWVAHLEKVHAQLKALSAENLGGYLDVRVYEDNFFVESQMLSRLGAMGIGITVWFNPPEQTVWTEPEHSSTLTIPEPTHFSCQLDEDHFFKWLQDIEGVKEVRGHLTDLTVYLCVPYLSDSALRDLIGLLHRYSMPMVALQTQLKPQNEHWFKNPDAYWYEPVFNPVNDLADSYEQSLSVKIVWEDDHMIEVECTVRAGTWAAESRAYTQRPQLAEFAKTLKMFAKQFDGSASFEAGGEGIGSLKLRFYPNNNSRHLACFVELGTSVPTDHRPEEISRLSLEVHTEAGFVDAFAEELEDVAAGSNKEARLRLVR